MRRDSIDRLMFFVTANPDATYADAEAWSEHSGHGLSPAAWRSVFRQLKRTAPPAPKTPRKRRMQAEGFAPSMRASGGRATRRLPLDETIPVEELMDAVRRINAGARVVGSYSDGRWMLQVEGAAV